jgi:hypothetical protein
MLWLFKLENIPPFRELFVADKKIDGFFASLLSAVLLLLNRFGLANSVGPFDGLLLNIFELANSVDPFDGLDLNKPENKPP